MKTGFFCPSCGATKGPFFEGLCKKCFLTQKTPIQLPAEIKIQYCKHCNRIRLSGKWVEQSEKALKDFVLKKAKINDLQHAKFAVQLTPVKENALAILKASALLGGNKISVEAKTLLVAVPTCCNECMLLASNYHEAVLQLRFSRRASETEKRAVLREIEELLRALKKEDLLARIVAIIPKKNGFDVLLASNNAAKKIVKELSKKTTEPTKRSFSVTGRKRDGKEKKRFTYCLRF